LSAGAESLFGALVANQGSQPFVTYYDDASGERAELSARSLGNWVAKTHFLLLDELGLGPGDTAVVALPADWTTVAILLGCWSAGLQVTATGGGEVGFADPATLAHVAGAAEAFVVNPASMTRSFGAGAVPAGTTDYVSAVRPQADAWAAVSFRAHADDPAIDGGSRAELVAAASARAEQLELGPGARLLYDRAWTGPADWIDAVVAPLVVGGSVVLVANADPAKRARRIEQEQVTATL
jgi:uncharacterized protein (TIGR03089 family)